MVNLSKIASRIAYDPTKVKPDVVGPFEIIELIPADCENPDECINSLDVNNIFVDQIVPILEEEGDINHLSYYDDYHISMNNVVVDFNYLFDTRWEGEERISPGDPIPDDWTKKINDVWNGKTFKMSHEFSDEEKFYEPFDVELEWKVTTQPDGSLLFQGKELR